MSDSRIVTIRKSENIDTKAIIFPLVFVKSQFGFSVESILRDIYSSPDVYLGKEPSTFPNTIQEYFWIHEGKSGEDPWIALGELKGNIYFLYTAYMILPSNTFVNNGHMNLWVSSRFSDIIQFAMDSSIYTLYINSSK